MHSLQKEFLPLTNQLGKILENFRNFFVSSIGRQRERPKLNTIFKKHPSPLYRTKKYAFGPNFFIPQLVGIENVLLFGFLLKFFTPSLISWEKIAEKFEIIFYPLKW